MNHSLLPTEGEAVGAETPTADCYLPPSAAIRRHPPQSTAIRRHPPSYAAIRRYPTQFAFIRFISRHQPRSAAITAILRHPLPSAAIYRHTPPSSAIRHHPRPYAVILRHQPSSAVIRRHPLPPPPRRRPHTCDLMSWLGVSVYSREVTSTDRIIRRHMG